MGTGHSHLGALDDDAPDVRVALWPRIVVLGLLVVCGVLAVIGIVRWWPDGDRAGQLQGLIPYTAPGVAIVHGQLLAVQPICTEGADLGSGASSIGGSPDDGSGIAPGGTVGAPTGTACGDSQVKVLDGPQAGTTAPISLTPDVTATGLRAGDRVLLLDTSAAGGGTQSTLSFFRADRDVPLIWLVIAFVLVVLVIGWLRGLMALLSLAFSGLVVAGYLIPALLSGQPAVPATLAASAVMMIVMLYATHGISMRTSVALLGALVGIGLSTLGAALGVVGSRLGGLGDESAGLLVFNVGWIDVQQLVIASIVVAGLGMLNDVTVTQVSAIWELRAASPGMSRLAVFRSAMRIGRDHIASSVYTIVFAYLGTALVLLVAVQLYGGGPHLFVTGDDVAEEIVRTLIGGIALVLAMPVTTAIGAFVIGGPGAYQPKHARLGAAG